MMDDPVHHGELADKGNDAHLAPTLGTEQGITFFFNNRIPRKARIPAIRPKIPNHFIFFILD
jgi:hypothetical protein